MEIHELKKHRLNIFPEMDERDYAELTASIVAQGFNDAYPVVLYEGAVLDGWNRYRAATEVGVGFAVKEFDGNDLEAMQLVKRTNIRRNLTSQQRAAIAVEAEDLIQMLTEETERQRREMQAATLHLTKGNAAEIVCDNFLSQTPAGETGNKNGTHYEIDEYSQIEPEMIENAADYDMDQSVQHRQKRTVKHKLAKEYNTNRSYISDAMKLKETAPEKLAEVIAGTTTFQQIKKEAAEAEPSVDPDDPTRNEFTATAARLSKSLHTHFHAIEDLITQAKTDWYTKEQDFLTWCPNLSGIVWAVPLIDVKLLRSLRVCKYCNGEKCPLCHETGYLSGVYFVTKN